MNRQFGYCVSGTAAKFIADRWSQFDRQLSARIPRDARLFRKRRHTHLLAAAILFLPVPPAARSADTPEFEQAAVRLSAKCIPGTVLDPGRISIAGAPLRAVLAEAFRVKLDRISGPPWLDSDCISLNAIIPAGASRDQVPDMLQNLFAERFGLAAHRESHPEGGFVLTVDKGGIRMKPEDPDAPGSLPQSQVRFGFGSSPGIKGALTMALLARHISIQLHAPVEDRTGLTGKYNVDLKWAPPLQAPALPGAPDATSFEDTTVSVAAALRDSLGLRLEPRKISQDTIVIDRINRSPNAN